MNKMRAPFFRNNDSVFTVMIDLIIASVPAAVWGVYVFGLRCVSIYVLSIGSAVISEIFFNMYVFKNTNTFDLSSVVSGIVIAFALPATVPLWIPAFAAFIGITLGKAWFGGIGKNIFNPAATGICVTYLLFSDKMLTFVKPFADLPALSVDVPSGIIESSHVATLLDEIRAGITNPGTIIEEFYGLCPGGIGEISVVLLLVGFLYLLYRRTIHFDSAFAYIITIMLLSVLLCYTDYETAQFMEAQLFTGPVMLIMVYMLNDYTTTPTTSFGRIVFGALLGAGIFAIRKFGDVHYGEYFVLLCLNAVTPFIEKFTKPTVYGTDIRSEDL